MALCNTCNGTYELNEMADWTLCFPCRSLATEPGSYMDELGIEWSKRDIDEIGGIAEIKKLHAENKCRGLKP